MFGRGFKVPTTVGGRVHVPERRARCLAKIPCNDSEFRDLRA